jgi:hypothetical protein
MIGKLYGDYIFNVVEPRYEINFALNRVGFNNGDNLAIRQNAMYFYAFKCRHSTGHGIGAAIKTADYYS